MTDPGAGQYRQRDAASIFVLGLFVTILGLLVLIGSFWIIGQPRALVVNLTAGGLMFLIGLAMLFVARRLKNPPNTLSADNSKDSV